VIDGDGVFGDVDGDHGAGAAQGQARRQASAETATSSIRRDYTRYNVVSLPNSPLWDL
jgi:hypothetical protein